MVESGPEMSSNYRFRNIRIVAKIPGSIEFNPAAGLLRAQNKGFAGQGHQRGQLPSESIPLASARSEPDLAFCCKNGLANFSNGVRATWRGGHTLTRRWLPKS
jgi:hypothetical protein